METSGSLKDVTLSLSFSCFSSCGKSLQIISFKTLENIESFIVTVNSDDKRLLTKTMTKENARDAYLTISLEEWTAEKIIQRSSEVKIPVCVVVTTFHKNITENAKLVLFSGSDKTQ